jgi:hypothetical protein
MCPLLLQATSLVGGEPTFAPEAIFWPLIPQLYFYLFGYTFPPWPRATLPFTGTQLCLVKIFYENFVGNWCPAMTQETFLFIGAHLCLSHLK